MTGSLTGIRWLAVMAVLAAAVVLSACGEDAPPTSVAPPTTAPVATPADTPTPPPTTAPAATPAPESTDTPTDAPPPVSFEEYLASCRPLYGDESIDLDDDTTNGEFSALIAEIVAELEAVSPPAEVAEWHNALLASTRNAVAIMDALPPDQVVDFGTFILLAVTLGAGTEEAQANLPEDVRSRLAAAGCIEDIEEEVTVGESSEGEDDYGDSVSDATPVDLGVSVVGALESDGDADFFSFQAEAGETYRIDVALGTLEDSLLVLYDAGERELDNNDDHGHSSASRIFWEAPASGEYYFSVTGVWSSTGSYTVTVDIFDVAEDPDAIDRHGDSASDATPVTVGESVEGALQSVFDADFFSFRAEAGKTYRIEVAFGSPKDCYLSLYDSEEQVVAFDDHPGESRVWRINWEAPASGEYYVQVTLTGFLPASGSYTLSVRLVDTTDDHSDVASDATAVAVGESVGGVLQHEDDADVFHFRSEPGEIYRINLAPESAAVVRARLYYEPDEWNDRFVSPEFVVTGHWDMWQPGTGREAVYIVVKPVDRELGTYALTVERIAPEAIWTGSTDYDADDNGLIEVSSLAQLNAIRWDLDGNGLPDGASGMAGYAAAFDGLAERMGCPDGRCSGYELTSNLDFDTNGSGSPDPGDVYWNEGKGWEPIGKARGTGFVASFDGGGHTISNLYIDRTEAENVGLFGLTDWDGVIKWVGLNNNIRNVALINVDVNGGRNTGGLVGNNGLVIAASYVTGSVNGDGNTGGLVGGNFGGDVLASYSTASVSGRGEVGGLVGNNFGGDVVASYSTGSVTSETGDAGGLVENSFVEPDSVRYSYWDTQTSGQAESAGGEGKTTSELQSPTSYEGIYENWDLDLDEDGTGDDLWDFGTSSQYPTLRRVGK